MFDDNAQIYPCPVCKLNCYEETDCINCDKCLNWYHYSCTDLTKAQFNILCQTDGKFMCHLCSTKICAISVTKNILKEVFGLIV